MNEPSSRAAELVQPLLRVRQIRDFADRPVTRPEIDAIADAARWSGSSSNSQPWRFVVLRDRATIRRLGDATMPQSRALQTAPAAIAIVLPDEPGKAVLLAYDEGRAAERILVAASVLGLGAGVSWVMAEKREPIRGILGLPQAWFVRTIIAIGHPSAVALRLKSAPGAARLPRSEVVFDEKWPQV